MSYQPNDADGQLPADRTAWQQPNPDAYGSPTQPYPMPDQTQNLYGQPPWHGAEHEVPTQLVWGDQAAQNPYPPQDQSQYSYQSYGRFGQTYPRGYPAGRGTNSRIGWIAAIVAVVVLGAGSSIYWFGFHSGNSGSTSPVGLNSPTVSAARPETGVSTDSADSGDGSGSEPQSSPPDLSVFRQVLSETTDPGCKTAFQSLIAFEDSSSTDSDDGAALLQDYQDALDGLTRAESEAEDPAAAEAIGNTAADWKAYVDADLAGQAPNSSRLSKDGQSLAMACAD